MMRCGYIALLGAPNAGKSTLMNRLVGHKLAIVTPKAQTTRSRITGVTLHGQAQMIFLDVPGVFDPGEAKQFERAMVDCAWQGVADADVVLLIIDAQKGWNEENQALLDRLKTTSKPACLAINKIDLVPKERLLELAAKANETVNFEQTFMISALKGDGTESLLDALAEVLPDGPWLYPEDHLTDVAERVLASEITREQCFFQLREELPYSLTVETEAWEEKEDGSIKIDQVIYVEREGQKGIVLGKGGAMLKKIGEKARKAIEKQWGCRVHLFVFVKVREKWKIDPEKYNYLGLEYK